MPLAPIVLFVYNRPDHTRLTVEALLQNDLSAESELYIFADAAKNAAATAKVKAVRDYISTIQGFKSVTITERASNFGLAASVIDGVTKVIDKHGKGIVLEDDLVTSPHFLSYMNKSLDLYEPEEEVISIHGYNYPVKLNTNEKTFFLKGADCWGWATWKRGWDLFEPEGAKLMAALKEKNLTKAFDFGGSYPYTQMLQRQIAGKNDSWAIRWYAAAFLQDKYTLYPVKSLVRNIGLDLSGTHSGKEPNMNDATLSDETFSELRKIPVQENDEAKAAIAHFFRKNIKVGIKQRILNLMFR